MTAANDDIGARIGMLPELPENPVGWTRRMVMHMNFGGGSGSGVYVLLDPAGQETPIQYEYHTKRTKKGSTTERGFSIRDRHSKGGYFGEPVETWHQLRELWKQFVASRTAAERAA